MDGPQPPDDPELVGIIEKLAQFVAKNGPEFERMTAEKQRDNPRFNFLSGGEHYAFYQWCLHGEINALRNGRVSAMPPSSFTGGLGHGGLNNMPYRPPLMGGPGPRGPPPPLMALRTGPMYSGSGVDVLGSGGGVDLVSNQGPPCHNNNSNVMMQLSAAQHSLQNLQNNTESQIQQSEANLAAQYQSLMSAQQSQMDEAMQRLRLENAHSLAKAHNFTMEQLDQVIQPLVESCTKENIARGKSWLLERNSEVPNFSNALMHCLLAAASSTSWTFTARLHVIYLLNDVLHHCKRRGIENLLRAIESVVVVLFSLAAAGADDIGQSKLTKLVGLWRQNGYFSEDTIDALDKPAESLARWQHEELFEHDLVVQGISNAVQQQYASLQKQHQEFVQHLHKQMQQQQNHIQQLQDQLMQQQQQQQMQVGATTGWGNAPPPPQNFDLHQPPPGFGLPPPPPQQRYEPLPDFSKPPPGFGPMPHGGPPIQGPRPGSAGPGFINRGVGGDPLAVGYQPHHQPPLPGHHIGMSPAGHQRHQGGGLIGPGLVSTPSDYCEYSSDYSCGNEYGRDYSSSHHMPVGGGGDLMPPAFETGNSAASSVSSASAVVDLIPTVPYYNLPAGLMVPMISLDATDYKPLEASRLRLPPPLPPSDSLLAAVEQFYSPPSHDRPRDAEGWERLGLYEFYKSKERAKKAKADGLVFDRADIELERQMERKARGGGGGGYSEGMITPGFGVNRTVQNNSAPGGGFSRHYNSEHGGGGVSSINSNFGANNCAAKNVSLLPAPAASQGYVRQQRARSRSRNRSRERNRSRSSSRSADSDSRSRSGSRSRSTTPKFTSAGCGFEARGGLSWGSDSGSGPRGGGNGGGRGRGLRSDGDGYRREKTIGGGGYRRDMGSSSNSGGSRRDSDNFRGLGSSSFDEPRDPFQQFRQRKSRGFVDMMVRRQEELRGDEEEHGDEAEDVKGLTHQ